MSHTHQPFAKINFDFPFAVKSKRGAFTTNYGPIAYYKLAGQPVPFSVLKAWRPDSVRWVEIDGDGIAGPHRDHGLITTLNCYLKTNDEITHFWEPKPGVLGTKYEASVSENLYKTADLEKISSFIANTGDAFLLNVSKVHSVERPNNGLRVFIQLSWNTEPYDKVLQIISQTCSVA